MPHTASQTFLRVSDSYARRQAEIEAMPKAPKKADTGIPAGSSAHETANRAELEERDYHIEKIVFRVPALGSDDIPVVSRTRVATGM